MRPLSVSAPQPIEGYVRYTVSCAECGVETFVGFIASLVAGNEEALRAEFAVRVAHAGRRSTVMAVRLLADDAEPTLRRGLLVKKCTHVWPETEGSMPPPATGKR
jgi:hypothetical protein